MSEHDYLIREARWAADWHESHDGLSVSTLFRRLADALEARPSLVADTREALAEALHYAQRFDDWGVANEEEREWSLDIADALLAPGGPVRLADATPEQGWEEGHAHCFHVEDPNSRERNPYDGFTRKETNDA